MVYIVKLKQGNEFVVDCNKMKSSETDITFVFDDGEISIDNVMVSIVKEVKKINSTANQSDIWS